ncbi:MAG: hypothetical protein O3A00_20315 [Planctomycetota bacterium]|nr:hypothetical protein [Planctomycetota bacterium]
MPDGSSHRPVQACEGGRNSQSLTFLAKPPKAIYMYATDYSAIR